MRGMGCMSQAGPQLTPDPSSPSLVSPCPHPERRYHSKALLVTFDADNSSAIRVDALTREVQEGFKRMDREIRAMGAADRQAGGDDDAQVWWAATQGATCLGPCRLALGCPKLCLRGSTDIRVCRVHSSRPGCWPDRT